MYKYVDIFKEKIKMRFYVHLHFETKGISGEESKISRIG